MPGEWGQVGSMRSEDTCGGAKGRQGRGTGSIGRNRGRLQLFAGCNGREAGAMVRAQRQIVFGCCGAS